MTINTTPDIPLDMRDTRLAQDAWNPTRQMVRNGRRNVQAKDSQHVGCHGV